MPDTPGRKDRAATQEESTSLGSWAGSWSLDPSRSSLRFRSSALWGLVKVHGEFTDISGEGSVAPDGTVSGRLEIAAASVDTGKAKRDRHLRSADFFDALNHPSLMYTVDDVVSDGPGHLRAKGNLRIADETHPLELTATIDEVPPDGVVLTTQTEVDRSRWGLTFKKMGMTKMATSVDGRLTFTRSATPDG